VNRQIRPEQKIKALISSIIINPLANMYQTKRYYSDTVTWLNKSAVHHLVESTLLTVHIF
jgi:hypothetical protein